MEPLFLCIVVITSVNGKEKAGGMCNGSSNDFNTGSRSSKHYLYDRYAGYSVSYTHLTLPTKLEV